VASSLLASVPLELLVVLLELLALPELEPELLAFPPLELEADVVELDEVLEASMPELAPPLEANSGTE
jgi:hypothetical protein